MEKVLGLTQSNVSRHLQILKSRGMVSCRKTAQWIYYRISDEFCREYGELCEFLKTKFLSEEPFKSDLKKLKEEKVKGFSCEKAIEEVNSSLARRKRKERSSGMKPKVAFVCVGNSCRSQMAEGFARYYGSDLIDVYSAGTEIADKVNPLAIEVMKEKGIDISHQFPKTIFDIPKEVDYLITMGCGVECPYIPCRHKEDWGLSDPAGKPIEEFRKIRDEIEKKVLHLLERVKKEYYYGEAK